MKFSIDKQEKHCILTLDEEKLTSIISPELKSELVKLSNEGFTNIVLNLSPVKYIDSSGLSAILTGNRLAKDNEGNFILTSLSEYVIKLINISKLDTILDIHKTDEEAVDAIFLNELESDIKKETEE